MIRPCIAFLIGYLILIPFLSAAVENGAEVIHANGEPTEETFIKDALNDALHHYSLLLNQDYHVYKFSMYEAFFTDLNQDGENEYIVSGSLTGQSYYVVMAYFFESGAWTCVVLNRCVGGGINDVKVIDLDNDGFFEIFSVLQDRDYKRTCKIYRPSVDRAPGLIEMFSYNSSGGLLSSHNFSIFRSKNSDNYNLRIDEVLYPDTEDGDVQQTTYIYKIIKKEFVLDKAIKGGATF